MNGIKKILIWILVALMTIQLFQFFTGVVPQRPLYGVYHEYPLPEFSWQSWNSWEYQANMTHYFEHSFGFRPFFIRLNNQVYYSLFNSSTNGAIVIGKDRYLFEKNYIESYYGGDFLGELSIDSSIYKLDTVMKYLKHWDTDLVFVVTPNKANYFSEYIPDYLVSEKSTSNYDVFMDRFVDGGYPVVDANSWFREIKPDAQYPLMTKAGTHWSFYGAAVFGDTLLSFIESELDTSLSHYAIDSIEYPQQAQGSDKDLEDLLNVLTPLNDKSYAYPRSFLYYPNNSGYKPNLLVIGDSFFWPMYQEYFVSSFHETWFWYYFSTVVPSYSEKTVYTSQIDVIENAAKTDILLILSSPDNLEDFGFGFIDYVYDFLMMDRAEKYSHLLPRYLQLVRNSEDLMKSVKEKAAAKQISIDSMIYLDADWLVDQRLDFLESSFAR